MCSLKGYCFSAMLVIKKVLIWAILVMNRVLLLPSSLDVAMIFHHDQKDHKQKPFTNYASHLSELGN